MKENDDDNNDADDDDEAYDNIYHVKGEIAKEIDDICSRNTVACEKACAPHVCCWDEDDACYGEVRGCCYFVSILCFNV